MEEKLTFFIFSTSELLFWRVYYVQGG